MEKIMILGQKTQSGAYLLRLWVGRDVRVRFGRFQGGRLICVPRGDVLYVGSALAKNGSMTLARRLLRHATRSGQGNPQPIREAMLNVFAETGLGTAHLQPPQEKKLFWNIDYLLEEPDVNLSHVVALRTNERIEDDLAQFIEAERGSSAVEKGLGAHDRPSDTHLFWVKETAEWWSQLPVRLEQRFNQEILIN